MRILVEGSGVSNKVASIANNAIYQEYDFQEAITKTELATPMNILMFKMKKFNAVPQKTAELILAICNKGEIEEQIKRYLNLTVWETGELLLGNNLAKIATNLYEYIKAYADYLEDNVHSAHSKVILSEEN